MNNMPKRQHFGVKMKIAFWHFYTLRLPRGIETLVISLANALADRGHDVSIITAKGDIKPLVTPNARVRVYAYPTAPFYSHLSIVPAYTSHFLRHTYDSIVVFFADFGEDLTWKLLHHYKDLPLSLYLCYPYSTVPHRYHSFLRLGWHHSARHVLADAVWVAREAEELFQRPVPVVPVGTDPIRFRPDLDLRTQMRLQYGFMNDDVVLLNVSALELAKGTWRVIAAMGRLKQQLPQLHFYILGKGEDEPRLRQIVDDLGLNNRVFFGGVTPHLEAYYNMADIFVMLPDAEANSIASHEAMSCGLPLLVSSNGGFAESVTVDAGQLVNPHDLDAIDTALCTLAGNIGLRKQMGSAARAHVLASHSWDHVAERFLACLG